MPGAHACVSVTSPCCGMNATGRCCAAVRPCRGVEVDLAELYCRRPRVDSIVIVESTDVAAGARLIVAGETVIASPAGAVGA